MRCHDFLPLIEKLADGEAEPAERHQAEAHLESCTSCQAHLRFLRALPKAARQTSLPAPPEMYWDVLPRKIMSRIAKETAEGRGGWFGRLLTPSRLRWAGAVAAALVAAVVGLRVVEFPLGDRSRPSSSSASRSNEEKREAAISSHDAPASPALPGPDDTEQEAVAGEPAALSADSLTAARRQVSEEPVDDAAQEEALKDESFERPAGKRVAGEPIPPPAPDVAGEQFATGALAGAGKARQEKQDDSADALDRRVVVGRGGREGRLEQDLDELKSTQPGEQNRDEGRARSKLLAETANAPRAEAEDVKEPKPAVPARPADADPAAQPISLRSQQALKKTPATAEEVYRDLVSRYPRTEGDLPRSSGIAKEKEGVYSDAKLATECSDWRQFITRYRGDEREGDARYRLALCSIETFERSPSDANRHRAMEDGTSYLGVATDEEHAERIRRALEQLRP